MRLYAILLAACASLPTLLHAQKSPVGVSLEVYVAEAEQVFVGRIVSVGEPSGTGQTSQTQIGIDVDQVLKGTPVQHLSMDFVPDWYRWEVHPNFVRSAAGLPRSRRVLFCVMPLSRGHTKVVAIDLDNPDLQELSSSLVVLRQPDTVLKAARAAALRYPAAAQQLKTTLVEACTQESLKGSQFWDADNIILAADSPGK